jgi:hypothetical protein
MEPISLRHPARLTCIVTSIHEPSRLMIAMRRSAVNRLNQRDEYEEVYCSDAGAQMSFPYG